MQRVCDSTENTAKVFELSFGGQSKWGFLNMHNIINELHMLPLNRLRVQLYIYTLHIPLKKYTKTHK